MSVDIEEAELVELAKKGDKQALASIVRKNERMVYNTALRLVGNQEDAECVMQETFLKVIQSLPQFRGDSALSTWIYRIAMNFALMRLRERRKDFTNLELSDHQVSRSALEAFNRSIGNNPHRAIENEELREMMQRAIDELPPKFKTVFIQKDIEGRSLKEISELNEMSLPAVKSNLHRARLFLRNRLASYAYGDGGES